MDHIPPRDLPARLVQLTDQWTVLREQFAFLAEALLRLVADHPDLPKDVIQGAIQNVEETKGKVSVFNQDLNELREQASPLHGSRDTS